MKVFIALFVVVIMTLHQHTFAKGRNGDSFKIAPESTFLQREKDNILNGLQVLSFPLFGEPFAIKGKTLALIPTKTNKSDNLKQFYETFPNHSFTSSSLSEIEKTIPHSSSLNLTYWSNHTIMTKNGGIAFRYLDQNFRSVNGWENLFNEYALNPTVQVIANNEVKTLSPIEKYEYLIGNTDYSMTLNEWKEGEAYINSSTKIPEWIGICHGTTPATIYSKRPLHAITLLSFDELNEIVFYPSDLKELISYAWAKNSTPSAILGSRCREYIRQGQRPSPSCLDINPALFHQVTLNLLGKHQRPFLLDTAAGNEVWNKSVVGYRFKYFTPGSRNFTDSLSSALIKKEGYSKVGVWMELSYVADTIPSDKESDSINEDVIKKVTFLYDLEIDKEGNLVDGEWQSLNHPDFMWVIGDNILPTTFYDLLLEDRITSYNGKKALPKKIRESAKKAASTNQVLYTVISRMLELSQEKD